MTTSLTRTPLTPAWREEVTVFSDHVILFVAEGSARVMVDELAMNMSDGEALWIPPGFTVDLVETSAGGVVLPVFIPTQFYQEGPVRVHREQVAQDIVERLLGLYSRQQAGDWEKSIQQQFFTGPLPAVREGGAWSGLPPMPRALTQRKLARDCLTEVGFEVHDGEPVASSRPALRSHDRQYRLQTGCGLSYWCDRVRCFSALRKLSYGWDLEETAAAAGFEDLRGLHRVIRREVGLSPLQAQDIEVMSRERLEQGAVDLRGPVAEFFSGIPDAPAARTYSTVNDYHALIWVRRGSGRLLLNGSSMNLHEDDLLWIPGGIWHRIDVDQGGVIVPVWRRDWNQPMRRQNMIPFPRGTFPAQTLLYCSMAQFTGLGPYRVPTRELDRILPTPPNDHLASDPILDYLRTQPMRNPETQESMAESFGWTVPDFMIRFERSIGQYYSDWRLDRRNTQVRRAVRSTFHEMRELAVEMGYSCAPAYTRSFRNGHGGEAPSTYRERHDHRWMASSERW
ncbi:AraC family ligand binding domain-containing protein [Corynebacterium neomassiliense]|uniref:AraC family ligand binding domain-containing protein n=1 Tax=Corynebacterium neomassiliense TaxID=2079482 RepID=UPI00102FEF7C|nr:AraC family ligand binding domain-containing protein [Corynebacterium neomassiliense]